MKVRRKVDNCRVSSGNLREALQGGNFIQVTLMTNAREVKGAQNWDRIKRYG